MKRKNFRNNNQNHHERVESGATNNEAEKKSSSSATKQISNDYKTDPNVKSLSSEKRLYRANGTEMNLQHLARPKTRDELDYEKKKKQYDELAKRPISRDGLVNTNYYLSEEEEKLNKVEEIAIKKISEEEKISKEFESKKQLEEERRLQKKKEEEDRLEEEKRKDEENRMKREKEEKRKRKEKEEEQKMLEEEKKKEEEKEKNRKEEVKKEPKKKEDSDKNEEKKSSIWINDEENVDDVIYELDDVIDGKAKETISKSMKRYRY